MEINNLKVFELSYAVTICFAIYSFTVNRIWIYLICILVLYVIVKRLLKKCAGHIDVKGQGVFITGCDTGFGHDISRRLDSLGFTVFAGCLHPDGEGAKKLKTSSSKSLHIIPLDVGSDDSVEAAHDYVTKNMPKSGMWGIVSNAGFNVMGDVEWLTINLYNKLMNVNFYGAIRIIRRFLYLIRQSKGRVVIVTSVCGRISMPAESAYHVTKHSLETMADSLRFEMFKFGVRVSIVEPGNFSNVTGSNNNAHYIRYRTEADEMWNNASEDARIAYGREYLDVMIENAENSKGSGSASSTKPVLDALVDALVSGQPNTRYIVDGRNGWNDQNAILARTYGCMPTWLSDWLIITITKCGCVNQIKKTT